MQKRSDVLLNIIHVLAWIAALGLCVKAGSILASYTVSLYINEEATRNLYLGLDLSAIREKGPFEYGFMVWSIVLIIAAEALLFFTVIKIFQKINMAQPFHGTIRKLIERMAWICLFVGIFSMQAAGFAERYVAKGSSLPELARHVGHGDVFLFFAGILYFISLVYAKGIELQQENELTV
jgi:hypothetical protein